MSYGSRKRSYDQGGCVRGGLTSVLRRIMSSPWQTLRRRLVRTTATDAAVSARLDACRRPSRLYFSHFATRTVYITVDLYVVYAAIVQNRVFCLPYLHSTPPLGGGGSRRNSASRFVWKKTRMAWPTNGEKILEDTFIDRTHKRDRRTDTAWPHRPRLCIASRGKNWLFARGRYKTQWFLCSSIFSCFTNS